MTPKTNNRLLLESRNFHHKKKYLACGQIFPFGLNSIETKKVIQYLISNHDFQVQISNEGESKAIIQSKEKTKLFFSYLKF